MNKRNYNSDYSRWAFKSFNIAGIPAIEKLQSEIIETNDSSFAYFFAIDYGYKTHLMQKVILDQKDAEY